MKKIKVIYIRTQFWFNLKAGGSVAHTNSVLNGIENVYRAEIINNKKIYIACIFFQ
jgi:hypothetical protein